MNGRFLLDFESCDEYRDVYALNDRLLSLRKLGCTVRVIDFTGIQFQPEYSATDLLSEYPSVHGIIISNTAIPVDYRNLRQKTQLTQVTVRLDDSKLFRRIRFPKTIRQIHIIPAALIEARCLTSFLKHALHSKIRVPVSLVLENVDLVLNWEEWKIHRSVGRIVLPQRRNHPVGFSESLRTQGFVRTSRNELETVFERKTDVVDCVETKNLETPGFLNEDEQRELILKIIKEAFCG